MKIPNANFEISRLNYTKYVSAKNISKSTKNTTTNAIRKKKKRKCNATTETNCSPTQNKIRFKIVLPFYIL